MIIKAKAKYLRVGPKKLRKIVNMVRNKTVVEGLDILKLSRAVNRKYVINILKSVSANAKMQNPDVHPGDLKIAKIFVNEAPRIKRLNPRARGRADVMKRRSSHIEVEVEMPDAVKKGKK